MLGIIKKLIMGKGGDLLEGINNFHSALADHLTWLDSRSQTEGLCPEENVFLDAGKIYAATIGGMGADIVSEKLPEAVTEAVDASE